MYDADGVGLAPPRSAERVIVIVSEAIILINPKLG